MLRRGVAALVRRVGRAASLQSAAEELACSAPAAACAAFSSSSFGGGDSAWRKGVRSALGQAAARHPGRACQQLAATAAWRVSSWQQVRRQWGGGKQQTWRDRRGYKHFGGRGRGFAAQPGLSQRGTVLLAVCGTGGVLIWASGRQEVPYTHRMHSILVSPETEAEMGRDAFAQIVTEARMNGTLLPPNHPASMAVRRVGQRLAATAAKGAGGGFHQHLQQKGWSWEFAVIRSKQVNAFVVPGGKVVVYTGLLQLIRNEDELASVLAHETAHVVARHAAERITQMGAIEVARILAHWVFGMPIPSGPLATLFFLPNSRKQETEADVIGLQLMAYACYAPEGMLTMFQKMGKVEQQEGGYIPNFLRTHPNSSDRLETIRKMLPSAEALYETSGCEARRGPLYALLRRVDW